MCTGQGPRYTLALVHNDGFYDDSSSPLAQLCSRATGPGGEPRSASSQVFAWRQLPSLPVTLAVYEETTHPVDAAYTAPTTA